MRSLLRSVPLLLLPLPAAATSFAPVHAVAGDVYVELPGDVEAPAGPARRIGTDRIAFVRSLRGAPGEDRAVRLVAEEGVCEGRIGLEVLLGLYDSMDGEEDAQIARWMRAAKVRGCHGPFDIALIDPPASASPRALGPADETAAATVSAAKRLLSGSRALEEARAEWRPMFGDAERVRESAWRVGTTTFALVDFLLEGGECGSTVRLRTVLSRDASDRIAVVIPPLRLERDDDVVAIADLDADGQAEIVARRLDDAVLVTRLGGRAEVLLDGGEVPFFGCSC